MQHRILTVLARLREVLPSQLQLGLQVLNLSLDNWVEHSTVLACLPCHLSCLTCFGSGENECLSCPFHSHLVVTSCLHQNQRKSASIPVQQEVDPNSDKSLHEPGLSSRLPALVAVLSCAFILATFAAVFVLLQLHSGAASAPFCRRKKLPVMDTGGGGYEWASGSDSAGGKCRTGGSPLCGGMKMAVGMNSESDSEELEYHNEKTAFIRTQSALSAPLRFFYICLPCTGIQN